MVPEQKLEEMIRQVVSAIQAENQNMKSSNPKCNTIALENYPLGEKMSDTLRTPRGIKYNDITLENVLNGKVEAEDLRISEDTLRMQAIIAEKAGREFFASNLNKAAELTRIPDERIIEIYNALRPHRSTKDTLLNIANELEHDYQAKLCAAYVKEAAEAYEQRGLLKNDKDEG